MYFKFTYIISLNIKHIISTPLSSISVNFLNLCISIVPKHSLTLEIKRYYDI